MPGETRSVNVVDRGARWCVGALAILGVIAYGGAALVTVADILGRRVGFPVDGVVDLVQLFVTAGTWLVMPYAFMSAAHVSVDFVVNAVPPRVRAVLLAVSAAVAIVLLALMLWQGVETFRLRTMFGDTSQQLGIPIAWYWYPLLLGLLVSIPAVLLHLAEALRSTRRG